MCIRFVCVHMFVGVWSFFLFFYFYFLSQQVVLRNWQCCLGQSLKLSSSMRRWTSVCGKVVWKMFWCEVTRVKRWCPRPKLLAWVSRSWQERRRWSRIVASSSMTILNLMRLYSCWLVEWWHLRKKSVRLVSTRNVWDVVKWFELWWRKILVKVKIIRKVDSIFYFVSSC